MTINEFIESLHIIAKYEKEGTASTYFLEAEHDIIYSHLDEEQVSEDSEDGKKLMSFGWFLNADADVWSHYV